MPQDHKARWLAAFVDEMDLTELEAMYHGVGSQAYPPALMLKVVLLEMLEGRLSPSRWAKDLWENVALQWIGMGIRPRRTALYEFRDRVGKVITELHTAVVRKAIAAGLVLGESGVLDGTAIRACASRHRLLNQSRLQRRCAELEAALQQDVAGATVESPPKWMATTAAGRRQQAKRYANAQRILERRLAENAKKLKDRRLEDAKVMVSTSDPQAPLGRDKEKVFAPLYTAEYMVEPSSLVILSFDVFAQASDAGTLPVMLDQTKQVIGRHLQTVIADAGYVSVLDLEACAQREVELTAPYQENDYTQAKGDSKPDGVIGKDAFVWDAQEQTYYCPMGHRLEHKRQQTRARRHGDSVIVHQFQCSPEHCRTCPLRERCVRDPEKGRMVTRMEGQELLDAHRQRMQTPEAKAQRRMRGSVIERCFGDAKQHRNLRRLHGRGLQRARAEVGLLVLAQNAMTLTRLARTAVNPAENTS